MHASLVLHAFTPHRFPAEIYTFGGQYFIGNIGYALGSVLACLVYVPVLYPLGTITANEVTTNDSLTIFFFKIKT